jgi:subtilisin-like proprotein convertase family protein
MKPRLLAAPFLLALAVPAFADTFSFTSTDTPKPIPDFATTTSTMFVPIGGTIATVADLNVLIDLTHTFDSDLVISLRHDDTGTTVVLANQQGGAGQDYASVTFDDEAAQPISTFVAPGTGQSFRPDQALSAFIGETLMGNWSLLIDDVSPGDSGQLNSWTLSGTYAPEPGTYALFGLGALGLGVVVARRRRRAAPAK